MLHCILRISPPSVRMRENTDQKSSEYGYFSLSSVLTNDENLAIILENNRKSGYRYKLIIKYIPSPFTICLLTDKHAIYKSGDERHTIQILREYILLSGKANFNIYVFTKLAQLQNLHSMQC